MGSACFIKVTQSLIYHVRIITANLSQGYNSNMSFKIASHQTENYRVTTELYEGPLDLLLQLIERAELDITRLALAQVTDQYLVHLKNMQEHSAAEVSAFLVIAARLVQIKSEALLPRPVERASGEEDPGEALATQLRQYRKFKQVAGLLAGRETARLRTFLRLVAPPHTEGRLDLNGITLADLLLAALAVYSNKATEFFNNTTILVSRLSIREKIRRILQTLRDQGQSSFMTMLAKNTTNPNDLHLDTIVTFLALLELIKRRMIIARQETLFADITILPLEILNLSEEIDFDMSD
jgi:segregation and condensation protein A